ncbi:hypothetical protein HanIR_Chr15g0778421 [Helianthus annuus]|nr:hypothetical protein HanIR_Chr15g0778421 [Helianthus annuus]
MRSNEETLVSFETTVAAPNTELSFSLNQIPKNLNKTAAALSLSHLLQLSFLTTTPLFFYSYLSQHKTQAGDV